MFNTPTYVNLRLEPYVNYLPSFSFGNFKLPNIPHHEGRLWWWSSARNVKNNITSSIWNILFSFPKKYFVLPKGFFKSILK